MSLVPSLQGNRLHPHPCLLKICHKQVCSFLAFLWQQKAKLYQCIYPWLSSGPELQYSTFTSLRQWTCDRSAGWKENRELFFHMQALYLLLGDKSLHFLPKLAISVVSTCYLLFTLFRKAYNEIHLFQGV